MIKRVFLIVMDSFGIGELPDANEYGDTGSNTLKACTTSKKFFAPALRNLGLFNIDGIDCGNKIENPVGSFGKSLESSKGKDTIIGHWEIAGIISKKPLPTYPNGFPKEIIDEFEKRTGRKTLCNKPYSGTKVIADYGKEHLETGSLIVYTSADSVFQIAAHEEIVPIKELYRYCEIAREIMQGEHGVGRIIARPFAGSFPDFKRTTNRHDFALKPCKKTMLNILQENGFDIISVGKIFDIFGGSGISEKNHIENNKNGMEITTDYLSKDFNGLCFVNLVDFDMLYGHRNDIEGYANAVTEFDIQLDLFMSKMNDDDIVIVTADHGCDPSTPSTDHSREYVPILIYGKEIKKGINIGTRKTFADIGSTILEIFSLPNDIAGTSFCKEVIYGK